jgi:NAD(P)-dependent dehydrogenase (short-subunit alcohol dehydrogenase family)
MPTRILAALEVAAYDAQQTVVRYPLSRIAEPIDIACAALFLASDAANGITGQILNVDCSASA